MAGIPPVRTGSVLNTRRAEAAAAQNTGAPKRPAAKPRGAARARRGDEFLEAHVEFIAAPRTRRHPAAMRPGPLGARRICVNPRNLRESVDDTAAARAHGERLS